MQQELASLPATFTGYLSGEALARAYASADLFAFPSGTETFGQVVLEAMASRLPVVGLLSEGVRDLVEHGRTGLLLDVRQLAGDEQVEGYRTHLARLVHDHELRHTMSQSARSEAQQRSWPEAMECLMQGYQEVIGSLETALAA
jgi:glycosyltransferase involved in cell wall biosynthesis